MHRPGILKSVLTNFIVAICAVCIAGCLPSPHKPLGDTSEKKPPASTATVDRPIARVDVPVFEPKDDSTTDAPGDSILPGPLGGPAASDVASDATTGPLTNRLSLPAGPDASSNFSDTSTGETGKPNATGGGLLDGLPPALAPLAPAPTPNAPANPLPTPILAPLAPESPQIGMAASDEDELADSTTPAGPSPKLELPPAMQTPATPLSVIPETPSPSLSAPSSPKEPQVNLLAPLPTIGPALAEETAPSASTASDPVTNQPKLEPVPLVNVGGGGTGHVNRLRPGSIPLIPRDKFFSTPKRSRARISPDGKLIAFLADRDGVQNVFVGPIEDLNQAKPITGDRDAGIKNFMWAFTGQHILFLQDSNSSSREPSTHVLVANLGTNEIKDLTPLGNVAAYVAGASHKLPAEVVVAVNDRAPELHDLYRVNIVTGQRQLLQENTGHEGYEIDDDYRVRIAYARTAAGWRAYSFRSAADQPWKEFLMVNPEDATGTGIVGFDKTGDQIYFVDSRDRDLSVLKVIDLAAGREKRLADHATADVAGTLIHPTEKNVQAVTFIHDRQKWNVIDSRINADLEYLHTVEPGELEITSRTLDDTMWTVVFRSDDSPAKYYLYRRDPRSTKLLFNSRPDLLDAPLVKMNTVSIRTRDGLNLMSYLSLPPGSDGAQEGRPAQPLPMVLLVHGGPWARDVWGYNDLHQMLANRGYAVLSVNYRGSTGFGKSFANAGNREWAAKMHDDLLDAVKWSVDARVAQQDRIAIMGGGYGGYASLVGMTFSPTVFACGVDIVGPSNLVTLAENPPSYWADVMPTVSDRLGSVETAEGREFLMSRSPIRFADRIQRPVLIAQGANDPRATTEDADRILRAMRGNGVAATYVVYPDEGHGFKRAENRLAFYAVMEAFLAEHLGGRAEPIGSALSRSSAQIPAGRDQIRELERLGAAP